MSLLQKIRTKPSIAYRPDIDGLRALAVLSVLFFHAGLGFPGGYVGVDIFFVISGYLICGIIVKECEQGHFSIARFWERRIRRIFPAAAAMTLFVVIAGWRILESADLASLGRSVAAQAMLGSNFYFWKASGYFFGHPDQLPLLHTWSLAVEEQFYLIVPFVILAFYRRGRKHLLAPALWTAAALSLACSVYCVARHPQTGFYLLPSRAWELLVGALLHFMPKRLSGTALLREAVGWLGLAAIGFAILRYDHETPFPGAAALPPCLGTAMIIWSNTGDCRSLGRILSLPPLVMIGLVSYSLYLWHWPLLVYSKYAMGGTATTAHNVAMLGVSLVAAVASFFLVERPIRDKRVLTARSSAYAFYVAGTAVACSLGVALFLGHGFPSRYSPAALRYLEARNDLPYRNEMTLADAQLGHLPQIGAPPSRPASLLVWGDSHAMAMMPVLSELAKRNGTVAVAATHAATPPALGYVSASDFSLRQDCPSYNEAILRYISAHRIPSVLLIGYWDLYLDPKKDGSQPFIQDLNATVRALRAGQVKVYLMLDVPVYPFEVPRRLAHLAMKGQDPNSVRQPLAAQLARRDAEARLFQRAAQYGAILLDPTPYLMDKDGYMAIARGGTSLYGDAIHLTSHGAELLSGLFAPLFAPTSSAQLAASQGH